MTIWFTILGLAVTTALVKAAGPVVFGGRTPHPAFLRVVAMMAPALLAALVITSALVDGGTSASAPTRSASWRAGCCSGAAIRLSWPWSSQSRSPRGYAQ